MANPIFPLNEYIPDGEAHVFGDRVFLYGSHDQENGDRFCMRDYVVYSAPVDDLENWTNHGVSYRKGQDPRSTPEKPVDFYAPDCVQGNDGRYYLYYVAMGPNVRNFGPLSVAVADLPEGPFTYLGDIRYPDGQPMTKFLTNDPTVINDNGRIWLYYGWGVGRDFRNKLLQPLYHLVASKLCERSIKEIKETTPSIFSCAVVELASDMLTVKSAPKAVLDSKTTADRHSPLYQHAFYEAPSIRKFNDLFYLMYSTGENHELAYATSKFPDHGFRFGGVLISNSDTGFQGNHQPLAAGGTIHGGVEQINGNYYVFYHRCTNNTDFSRQACAEPIAMNADGSFAQVEMTTQGLHGRPLLAAGHWHAAQCCNLYHANTKTVQGNGHQQDQPTIVCAQGEHFITAIDDGTVIGYKYLHFAEEDTITITIRGGAGQMTVYRGALDRPVGQVTFSKSAKWHEVVLAIQPLAGDAALFFQYRGAAKIDFHGFTIAGGSQ